MSSMPPPVATAPGAKVPNHLAWSIVSTILATCLCCPLGLIGIVGIVYSSKVNSLLRAGDIAGAQDASNTAKIWCWVTTGLAVIGLLINIWYISTGQMQAMIEQMQAMQQLQQ